MAGRLDLAGRKALTALVAFFFPSGRDITYSWTERPPERVLLVRHDDRIGNLIMMKPLLQGVRHTWPEAEIGVLIGDRFARVYQEEPEVDRLWILEKRRVLRKPLLFFGLIRELRRFEYDIAFDCSHMHSFSLTGAALTRMCGAPVRVAYNRGRADEFCNLLVEPLHAEHHESDVLLNLLRPFVEELPEVSLTLHLSEEEHDWAEKIRAECGIGPRGVLVGVHVGGRDAKKWPLERHLALLQRILSLYRLSVVVICGPAEKAEAERLRETWGDKVMVFDELEVRQMMALVAHCDFFIGPDTGPMHVAVAFGVPTVAVFIEDNYKRYGPSGPIHRIVHATARGGEDEALAAFAELVSMRFRRSDQYNADPE